MNAFFAILIDLRAAIAVVAARERGLAVVLSLVYRRVCRVATRIERLMALWRAGKLPKMRAPVAPREAAVARVQGARTRIPSGRGWLGVRVWEVRAFGSQLAHLIATDAEFARFLAEVPQAARILRPLGRMLWVDELPVVLRKVRAPLVAAVATLVPDGVAPEVVSQFLGG